jgi:hypothetical protein
MKRWTCQRCGKETDRRHGLCNNEGEHAWIDTREYMRNEEGYKRYQQQRYENYINSPQGRQEIIRGKNAVIEENNAIINYNNATIRKINLLMKSQKKLISSQKLFLLLICIATILLSSSFGLFTGINIPWHISVPFLLLASFLREICKTRISKTENKIMNLKETLKRDTLKEDNTKRIIGSRFFDVDWADYWAKWERKKEHAASLFLSKDYAGAAHEYTRIGNEYGLPILSASAWLNAAHCYDMLSDDRTLACYKNAVLGYKKLVSQRHEGAQEHLTEAEQDLAKFLNRKN